MKRHWGCPSGVMICSHSMGLNAKAQRGKAATELREKNDARLAANPNANLVVLGDFNDTKAVSIVTTT